jgi:hypothetical protein
MPKVKRFRLGPWLLLVSTTAPRSFGLYNTRGICRLSLTPQEFRIGRNGDNTIMEEKLLFDAARIGFEAGRHDEEERRFIENLFARVNEKLK